MADIDTELPDRGALAALEKKYSTKASDGGAPRKIQRRKADVTIPLTACEPDTFDAPVVIGIEGISAAEELAALKGSADGTAAGFDMAKRSLRTLNGEPMRGHQRDLVWECLGLAGRTLIVNAFMVKCCGAGAVGLGKSLESTED